MTGRADGGARIRRSTLLFWAMPNIAVGLFVAAVIVFLALLQEHDQRSRRASLIEDILWQEQTIRLHLQQNEEAMATLAKDFVAGELNPASFSTRSGFLVRGSPEVGFFAYVDRDGGIRWAGPAENAGGLLGKGLHARAQEALERARRGSKLAYSRPFLADTGEWRIDAMSPMFREGEFVGAIVASYSLEGILQHWVPWWFAQRYDLSIVDNDGNVLASKLGLGPGDPALTYEVAFDPPGQGVLLRAVSYRAEAPLAERRLLMVVFALSAVMLWSLWALGRHMRRGAKAEAALRNETAFRKAMEDSVVTGLRAVDNLGRITYVNPAFCRMVGLTEAELVGKTPPLPYWAPEEMARAEQAFGRMLRGETPSTGVEHRIMRSDGQRIDVMMYVSPLIDASGERTGWMTAVNDITERKRAREELRASHERFVAVLDALDAAVSVAALNTHEVLYANGYFVRVFGFESNEGAYCHAAPWREKAQTGGTFETEVQCADRERWFQVRSREFRWVDGRAVRLELATDITERKVAEDMARQQEERLQFTGRLITMGEMASWLAHELNQPLSAIAGYSTGCLNRIQSGPVGAEDLQPVLEKIGAQAQRAGRIVRGIREFVQKAEPKCVPHDVNHIITEALAFAEIEAARRRVRIDTDFSGGLPPVLVDRVMIEQVLLNLFKNGIEAMLERPPGDRRLAIASSPAAPGFVEVSVADQGRGVPEEMAERVFAPFFTTKPEGMGMGLNICRSIIEFHKGRLWYEPNPAGGTIFRFTLPESTHDGS